MTFCTAADHWSDAYRKFNSQTPATGSHYLMAESHLGPWSVPKPFLDGGNPCRRYAGKIVKHNDKLHIMGFLYYDADGKFIGTVGDPVPLHINADGTLTVEE